jgi:hypothetical protein
MLTLAIPLAHLAFLTGDPADGAVSEEALIARIRGAVWVSRLGADGHDSRRHRAHCAAASRRCEG